MIHKIGPYANAYNQYGMSIGNIKRSQSDHTQQSGHHTQHHSHSQHHDNSNVFGPVSFQSDPSISYISQNATNTNPYSQSLVKINNN